MPYNFPWYPSLMIQVGYIISQIHLGIVWWNSDSVSKFCVAIFIAHCLITSVFLKDICILLIHIILIISILHARYVSMIICLIAPLKCLVFCLFSLDFRFSNNCKQSFCVVLYFCIILDHMRWMWSRDHQMDHTGL